MTPAESKQQLDVLRDEFFLTWGAMCDCMSSIAKSKGFYEGEHNPGELIALMHSELSELLEYVRKPANDSHVTDMDGRAVELADLIIRAMDFSSRFDLNVADAIIAKAKYNADRPYKHGKKF